ncbi:hypothetical protein [Kingella oralis]|nr:hypothetical protein [Kingella oralis]
MKPCASMGIARPVFRPPLPRQPAPSPRQPETRFANGANFR